MAGTTTTVLTSAILAKYLPGVQKTVFDNSILMQLFPPKPAPRGSTVTWLTNYGRTCNATTATEGQAMPEADTPKLSAFSVAKQPFQATAQVTKQAKLYTNVDSIDAAGFALDDAARGLGTYINTTLQATLEAAIDSGSSYGGLTRSTYNAASYEESTSTALALSHMEAMLLSLVDASRGAKPNELACMMSWTMANSFSKLRFGASNMPWNTDRSADNFDGGRLLKNGNVAPWNDITIVGVSGQTSGTILMFPKWAIEIYETEPITITPKDVAADMDRYLLSCDYQIVVKDPNLCGKLAAKT